MNNCLNYNLQVPETFIELFFRSSLISASFARNTSSPGKFDFEKTCKFVLVWNEIILVTSIAKTLAK